MAPLIQDTDISFSCTDDHVFDTKQQGAVAPLHESTLTATSTPRRVSFGAMVDVQEIMRLDEFTPEEISASWYDLESMKIMKEIARAEGLLLDAGALTTSETTSTRGLEHRTRPGNKRKRQARANAYTTVFLEIDFQLCEGFSDADAIADVYFGYSAPCAALAAANAKTDELEAMTIYDNETIDFWSSVV